jgi:hypothetical protein
MLAYFNDQGRQISSQVVDYQSNAKRGGVVAHLLLPILLTFFVGMVDGWGQSPITLTISNPSPIEGCDIITFTIEVCNLHTDARDAVAIVRDMEFFEVVDWGDMDVGSIGDPTVEKEIGTMAPDACVQLSFTAMAMTVIPYFSDPPGPVVRARAVFTLGAQVQTVNTQASCDPQGYRVLDGRNTPYSILAGVTSSELPDPEGSCDEFAKDLVNITILGEVHLDVADDYCIGGHGLGSMKMGKGAELVVTESSGLRLSANVESCNNEEMWRQIHVESGSRIWYIHSSIHSATISNAARAISLAGGSTAVIERVNFADNHVGVFMDGLETEGSFYTNPQLLRFSDLSFTGPSAGEFYESIDSDLRAVSGAALDRPFAGVVVRGCDFINLSSLESSKSKWNRYTNLPNGIFVNQSNVLIGRSTFFGIEHDPLNSAPTGYAIYSRSMDKHQLSVIGDGPANPIDVTASTYGIRSISNIGVYARYVKMHTVEHGIITTSLSAQSEVKVEDCQLTEVSNFGLRHSGLGKVVYHRNDIEMKDAYNPSTIKGQGILTNAILGNWHQQIDIADNELDLVTARGGIEAFMAQGEIRENSVNLLTSDLAVRHGIAWQKPFNASLSCNLINGDDYTSLSRTDALYVSGGTNTQLTCNQVDETGAGVRLFGMGMAMKIRANVIQDHSLGLAYGYENAAEHTTTGQQPFQGNYWTVLHQAANPANRYGAIHYGPEEWVILASIYRVNDGEGDEYLPKWWSEVGDWFESQSGSNADCTENSEPICEDGPGAWRPLTLDGLDERIMQDSIDHGSWSFAGKYRLMRRIADAPDMLLDSTYDAFYTAALLEDIADWHDVDDQIRQSWEVDGALQMAADQLRLDMHDHMRDILEAIDSLAEVTSVSDSTYWSGQLEAAIDDFMNAWQDWSPLVDSVDGIAFNRLADALTDNNALSVYESWEENEQEVTAIALTLVIEGRDTLSSTEITRLEAIAEQCPTWGGDAVWYARSLLAGIGEYSWDDEELCDDAEERFAEATVITPGFRVSPSPATDQVFLWSDMQPGAKVHLMDMYGRPVMADTYQGEGHELAVGHLAPGIYFIRLEDREGAYQLSRVMVVK